MRVLSRTYTHRFDHAADAKIVLKKPKIFVAKNCLPVYKHVKDSTSAAMQRIDPQPLGQKTF